MAGTRLRAPKLPISDKILVGLRDSRVQMRTALVRARSACSPWSFKSPSSAAASGLRPDRTDEGVGHHQRRISVRVSPLRLLEVLAVSPMTVPTGCRRNAWPGSLAPQMLASRIDVE